MSTTAALLQSLGAKSQSPGDLARSGLLLQRKCDCGSPKPSLTGECAECSSKRLLQTKLAIGASDDPLEREADRVSDQVMQGSAHPSGSGRPPIVQRYSGHADANVDTAPASVDRVLANRGVPLESTLRKDMEQRLGHDFSKVRVHLGADAEQSTRDVNATAFTSGHNIVFGADRFAPSTHDGLRLIAHELTHVVQQSNAGEIDLDRSSAQPHTHRSMSHTVRPILQRVTEQPELQAGIGVGSTFGGVAGYVVTCLTRLVAPVLVGMLVYRIVKILSASGAERSQLIDEFIYSYMPLLGLGTTICQCVPPQLIVALAEWGLQEYPDARAHLKHYLTGAGKPYIEDIPRIFREDTGIRAAIEQGIALQKLSTVDLRNIAGDSFSTQNWQNSLGGVDLFRCEILQDDASKAANSQANDGTAAVKVSIRDPYEWHPDEHRRFPCVHTGMEAMKASGAMDFISVGDGVVRLKVPKSILPLP